MAEAGLMVRQDAEFRANLDAIGAFAKRRSRPNAPTKSITGMPSNAR